MFSAPEVYKLFYPGGPNSKKAVLLEEATFWNAGKVRAWVAHSTKKTKRLTQENRRPEVRLLHVEKCRLTANRAETRVAEVDSYVNIYDKKAAEYILC